MSQIEEVEEVVDMEQKYDAPTRKRRRRERGAGKKKKTDKEDDKRYTDWVFTWNNPKHPEDKDKLLSLETKYIKFQYEVGEEKKTPHYQGQIVFKDGKTFTAVLKFFKYYCKTNIGYTAPTKKILKSINYVGKEEGRLDGPWEQGKPPKEDQGKRNDILEIRKLIKEGKSIRQIWDTCEHFGTWTRNHRALAKFHAMVGVPEERKEQTICYVYWGKTRCGKSEAAKIESKAWGGSVYWLTLEGGMNGKVWWDDYNGEENVVIDEFNCQIRISDLKRIIDSTPLRIPRKGDSCMFLAKRVWILSQHNPEDWYDKVCAKYCLEREALNSRLHYVEEFKEKFHGLHCDKCKDVRRFKCPECFEMYTGWRTDFVEEQQEKKK